MYKVKDIISYEFTRTIVLQGEDNQQIRVFDDSDLLGNDDFKFLHVDHSYNCKIGILGDISESGELFVVNGREKIGTTWFVKLNDDHQNVFYLEPDTNNLNDWGKSLRIEIERYDLLQVDNIIHGRYK